MRYIYTIINSGFPHIVHLVIRSIEIIGHIRKEYDYAYNIFNTFESQHNDIDKIIEQVSNTNLEHTENVSMLNSRLDDIEKKLKQHNDNILYA